MFKVLLFVLHFLFTGCIVVLAAAWLPADAMRRTALGGHAERLGAYLGTMIVMGLAVRKDRPSRSNAISLAPGQRS
jgi:hypothetical protein